METAVINDKLEVHSQFPDVEVPLCDLWTFMESKMKNNVSKTALFDPLTSREVTYKELFDVSDIIGHNLLADGFDVNKPFVICMTNCVEVAFIVLSIIRIGGTCALLSPELKQGEIQALLNQLEAEYIIVNKETSKEVMLATKEMNNMKIISREEHEGCLSFSDYCVPNEDFNIEIPKEIDPSSTVIILFSSGSTGLPKPIELSHLHLIEQIDVYNQLLDIEHLDGDYNVVHEMMIHGWTFMLLLVHMVHGKASIIMQEKNLEEYFKFISKYKVKKLFIPTYVAVQMKKIKINDRYDLSHIELIHVSTSHLNTEQENQLQEYIGPKGIVTKAYGLTELMMCCGIPTTYKQKKYESTGWLLANSVGKVIDCKSGENLGPNKNGEICIQKKYHFKGYLGNEEATREVMDKDGWYHTGDLGFFDQDGCFFIVDRLKEIINVRGRQVSPRELENLLLTHPSVLDVVVTPIPDEEAGELPHAWIVAQPGESVTAKELQDYVSDKLSKNKSLQGGVRFVKSIPKTANGKIRRKEVKKETQTYMTQ